MLKIPCIYFPTTVMLIDDNLSVLENLSLNLDVRLPVKLHQYPEQALRQLQSQLASPSINADFMKIYSSEFTDGEDALLKVNFDAIRRLLYNPNRFSQVTAIVVDHSMPKLTGLELCHRIKNSPVKKIMLTGEAGPHMAIDAFNQGVIDQFIVKATPDMQSRLQNSIKAAQWNYFLSISESILTAIESQADCALREVTYQNMVKQYFLTHSPCEFYLIDLTGSFLFIDDHGRPSWMIVRSEEELLSYYEIANDYAQSEKIPADILQNLKERKAIPFFFSEEDYKLPIRAWKRYMHSAQPLPGNNRFYVSIIREDQQYDIHKAHIKSYNDYLSTLEG